MIAFADEDPASAKGPIGCVGYCMSGLSTPSNAAARHPDRVRAAASVYGVRLVTEADDSPHPRRGEEQGGTLFRLRRARQLGALEWSKPFERPWGRDLRRPRWKFIPVSSTASLFRNVPPMTSKPPSGIGSG